MVAMVITGKLGNFSMGIVSTVTQLGILNVKPQVIVPVLTYSSNTIHKKPRGLYIRPVLL